jgi:hypothetical protein
MPMEDDSATLEQKMSMWMSPIRPECRSITTGRTVIDHLPMNISNRDQRHMMCFMFMGNRLQLSRGVEFFVTT